MGSKKDEEENITKEPCTKTYPNPCTSIANLEVTQDSKSSKPEARWIHKDVIPEAENIKGPNLWTYFPIPSPLELLQARVQDNIETQKEKDKNNPPPNSITPNGKIRVAKRSNQKDLTKPEGEEKTEPIVRKKGPSSPKHTKNT